MQLRVLPLALAALLSLAGCGTNGHEGGFTGDEDGGAHDGTAPPIPDGGLLTISDSGPPTVDCSNPNGPDLTGCSCPSGGAVRACWPAGNDPKTRGVGTCKDGVQSCVKSGEFTTWGPCTGAELPAKESCTATYDTNCNGKVGCADPACATDPACNTGCTDGQTRACYDGPAGTENVGICKDGTQTCSGGKWPSNCPGEVLPDPMEACTDALDHNCNGLAGCFDFFSCINNPACQGGCDSSKLDPGCVCPKGSGDTATCPDGTHGVPQNSGFGDEECCPCTASDCSKDPECCGESVCAGNAACAGIVCRPLPPSCNGQVNADCDDFPEDCDEPCCKCAQCDDAGP